MTMSAKEDNIDILIVDDERTIRNIIRRAIVSALGKMDIVEAKDGNGALQKAMETKPRLIILDWDLPGVDGMAVSRRVQRSPLLRHTRILAISGHSASGVNQEFFQCGASEFLAKPLHLTELLGSVSRLLA